MVKKCFCGNIFEDKGYGNFCSQKCYMKNYYVKRIVIKICIICGLEYNGKRSSKYCSDKCRCEGLRNIQVKYYRTIHEEPEVQINCKECGFKFSGNGRMKYCSKRCRNKLDNRSKRKNRGIKKPCEFCGFSDLRAIHGHHINRSQNGGSMSLCANHHYIFHTIVGNGIKSENKSKEEVLEVLKNGVMV